MGIKPDADNAYFLRRPVERRLAAELDEAFIITFGSAHGELSFWLAEAKDKPKERFGLLQEVLVIYSGHRRTDARVLTAIENISRSPDFKHRIDKVIALLVHTGAENEAQDLVSKTADRIIIPIHAKELTSATKGSQFLRSRIAAAIGQVDLFGMRSALRNDRYFFGRTELVQTLVNRFLARREHSGLFGLRKTGKTSVLFAIQRQLADRPTICEYIECSNPGIHSARWWQLLANITDRLATAVNMPKEDRKELTENSTPVSTGAAFTACVKKLIKEYNIENVLLMLDEVEFITPTISGTLGTHWDQDFVPFWQAIRATHQETEGRLCFMVAGVNPASIERPHFEGIQNPIFQLVLPHYLEPFTSEAIRQMAYSIGRYAGLKFDNDVYPFLEATYGGHPFLVRLACSEVWKVADKADPDNPSSASAKEFSQLGLAIGRRLEEPIKDILLSLIWWYPEEYELLQILATGDQAFVKEYLGTKRDSLVKFANYGLLKKDGSGELAIQELKKFLEKSGGDYKSEISPFRRGDMPLDLLPAVPDLELLGKLFEKRCKIELLLRRAIIMYLGIRLAWDEQKIAQAIAKALQKKKDRPDPSQLFVGQPPKDAINELYTIDLKDVVMHHWDTFSTLFDGKKDRCEMNLETLNKARRVDAHVKPISAEETMEFENSYTWLSTRLSKIPSNF